MFIKRQIKIYEKYIENISKKDLFMLIISFDFTKMNSIYGYRATTSFKKNIKNVMSGEPIILHLDQGSKQIYLLDVTQDKLTLIKNRINIEVQKVKLNLKSVKSFISKLHNSKQTRSEARKLPRYKLLYMETMPILKVDISSLNQKYNELVEESKKINNVRKKELDSTLLDYVKNNMTKIKEYSFNDINFKQVYGCLIIFDLWVKIQEEMIIFFKKEKINGMIGNDEKSDMEVSIEDWFLSVMYPHLPFMDNSQIEELKQIYEMIETRPPNIYKIKERINLFFTNFNPKGLYNISVLDLEISKKAREFVMWQLTSKYDVHYRRKIGNHSFLKKKYPIVSGGDVSDFYYYFKFFNDSKLFNQTVEERCNNDNNLKSFEREKKKKELKTNSKYLGKYFGMFFLELDGFNAFNRTFFSNESDKFYSDILNMIFETAYDLKNLGHHFLHTMTGNVLGDEIFLAFSYNELEEAKHICEFVSLVSDKIKNKFAEHKFMKTEKQHISNEKNQVVLRVVMPTVDRFTFREEEVTIGTLSVSAYGILNEKINNLTFKYKFKKIFYNLEKEMDEQKKRCKGQVLYSIVNK